MRRAPVSIVANLAEGRSHKTTGAFAHHVSIALGSSGELETCVQVAERLRLLPQPKAEVLLSVAYLIPPLTPNP